MSELTSDTIFFDILSRVPLKSLARFRSVSKLWCTYIDDDPHFAIAHNKLCKEQPTPIVYALLTSSLKRNCISFHVYETVEGDTSIILEAKKYRFFDFVPDIRCGPAVLRYKVSGSCNGLLYISRDYMPTDESMVIHPLKKQCFKLPPILEPSYNWRPYVSRYKSSGLGFDASTNTFKVVCVFSQRKSDPQVKFDQINKDLRTMVHVLGTDSWREIPTVPAYPINGASVFAHGRLHWLVSSEFVFQQIYIYHDRPSKDRRDVISFDVTTEEFGLVDPPKTTRSDRMLCYELVDLHGEVGYLHSYFGDRIELWVLKETEWAIYCCFDRKPPLPKGLSVKVLGRWNKAGDLLISSNYGKYQDLFIYSLKNGHLHSVSIVGQEDIYAYNKDDIYMYPSCGVFSIRGTKKNAYSKTN